MRGIIHLQNDGGHFYSLPDDRPLWRGALWLVGNLIAWFFAACVIALALLAAVGG